MNWQLFRDGDVQEALVHPTDAAVLGIADGDLVEVSTATGALRLPVKVTEAIVAGSVSIVDGFAAANVNSLMNRHELDPLSGMAHLSGVGVQVARC